MVLLYIVQKGLELRILLAQAPKSWDSTHSQCVCHQTFALVPVSIKNFNSVLEGSKECVSILLPP